MKKDTQQIEKVIVKDTRPVRCYICGCKMYYFGHLKSEPEYKLYDYGEQIGYVHASCITFLKKNHKYLNPKELKRRYKNGKK